MDSDSKSQVTAVSGDKTSPKSSVSSVELVEKYNNFKVDQLKKKLKELNLPITGKKSELIDRLLHSEQSKEENKTLEESKFKPLDGLSNSELRKLRKSYHLQAEELRVKRDDLNLKSQNHASERNDLNLKAKGLMEEVHIYRDRRNGLNVEVGEIRDRHRDYLREVKILKENFFKLKRQRFSGKNLPPLSKLRKQIQELEIKQMTTPLTTEKERALVEEIGSLQNRIKEHDALIETDTEVLDARDAFRKAESERRELNKSMHKSRSDAQTAHNQMKDFLKLNRTTRRKADSAQRLFVRVKEKADEVHNEYIEFLRSMQEIDRITASQGKSGTYAEQKASAANAEDLFAKFLAGEKLSTEQLMIIQKAGML